MRYIGVEGPKDMERSVVVLSFFMTVRTPSAACVRVDFSTSHHHVYPPPTSSSHIRRHNTHVCIGKYRNLSV